MRKSVWAAAVLMLMAGVGAARAQDAGVLRLYQGGREIGREVFRDAGNVLETTVIIPLIGMKLVSRMEWAADGRPIRTEERLYNLRNDSLRRSYAAVIDGDSVRMTLRDVFAGGRAGPGTPKDSTWAKAFGPDAIAADQNLSPYIRLVQGAARQPRTWRVFLPNADSVFEIRLAWRGDTADVAIGPQQILMRLGPDGRVATVDIPVGGVHYERFTGTWELPPLQGLTRPAPDYSAPAGAAYTAEEVRVPVRPALGDTFNLGCTLTKPVTGGPRFPAAITLTGSGLQDRDENLWPLVIEYRVFRQVAERLAAAGIAVLRCDDRGFGASRGPLDSVAMADFAVDAAAQLAWLRARADVDPRKLAIIGHSEGGSVGPMVAAEDLRLAALVVMAGMGKSMALVLRDQFLYPVERAAGLTPEQRATAREQALRGAEAFGGSTPYMRYFRDFDPIAVARRVRTPVLIVQGLLDRQISQGQADTLAAGFRAGGNRDVTVRKFEGLNHLFLVSPSGTGAGDEYASLTDVAVPAAVLDTIAEWLRGKLR
jgi:hypothetical protein